MRKSKQKYKVVGSSTTGYGVVTLAGGIEYDLLESLQLAKAIRRLLNKGIGPEWDEVEPILVAEGVLPA